MPELLNLLWVFLSSVLAVAYLFLITRILGYRQLSQLSPFDYVNGISIGSIAANLATNPEDWAEHLVALTVFGALTLLGSAHNWGTCQNAASMGVIAAWFGIACVIMMVVITQITGPWIRRTGAKTIGDFLNKVFGKVPGTMISCVNAALSIAMVCLEVETIAITLSFLTGWSYMMSAIVGGILAMLYVLLAGM